MHADEVVSVHDSVNETIQQDSEVDVTIIHNICIEPVKEENSEVMINMKERELTPLLSKHNEDCIPKIPNLRNVKEPKQILKRWILEKEIIARQCSVSITVGQKSSFDSHVGTEEDLRYVVHEFDWIGVNCWNSCFHNCRPDNDEGNVSECYSYSTAEVT